MNKFNKHMTTLFLTGSLALSMAMNQHVHAADKLVEKNDPAGRSTELVVDPQFNFTSSKKVVLDITVSDDLNQPMPGVLLKVYAMEDPKRIKGIKRKLKSTLLTVVRTDATGAVQREVEIPEHYLNLKIEKMVMSDKPATYLSVNGQERIHVQL